MIDFALLLLAGGGLALGAIAAQIGEPVRWNWRPRAGSIHHRLRCLPRGAPPAPWRAAGMVLLASLLAGGTLTAYAAAPSAPERLAAQAAGVVGSGDQLSLKLNGPGGERTLKLGETYADGWTLKALTPTQATLAKDGETREVGLNPTGAVAIAATPAPPSTVTLAGLPDEAAIQRYVDLALAEDPKAVDSLRHGQTLTVEEARRNIAYNGMINDEIMRRRAIAGSMEAGVDAAAMRALLGEAGYADMMTLAGRVVGAINADEIADLAARPITGPSSYYVPAGANPVAVEREQGVDRRGLWAAGPLDAQGGRTYTLTAATPEQFAAQIARDGGVGVVRAAPAAP